MGICRLCSQEKDKLTNVILNKHILLQVKECVSIEITENDGLPTDVCLGCMDQVISWSQFKSMCIQSNEFLRSRYLEKDQIKIEAEHTELGVDQDNNTGISNVEQHIKEDEESLDSINSVHYLDDEDDKDFAEELIFADKLPLKNVKEHQWSEDNMTRAVKAVQTKQMGYLLASKKFNVPRATLFRYCQKNKNSSVVKKESLGRKPVLTAELEKKLVDYLLSIDNKCLTRRNVCSIAFQLAKENNIPNAFSLLHQAAGKDWLKRFLSRHENVLFLRRPTGTSVARAVGFIEENVA